MSFVHSRISWIQLSSSRMNASLRPSPITSRTCGLVGCKLEQDAESLCSGMTFGILSHPQLMVRPWRSVLVPGNAIAMQHSRGSRRVPRFVSLKFDFVNFVCHWRVRGVVTSSDSVLASWLHKSYC